MPGLCFGVGWGGGKGKHAVAAVNVSCFLVSVIVCFMFIFTCVALFGYCALVALSGPAVPQGTPGAGTVFPPGAPRWLLWWLLGLTYVPHLSQWLSLQ